VIQLNPDDPTYSLPFEMRDTSKDPKREPGPIHLNRQVFGNPFMGIPTFYRRPVAINPEDLVAGKVDAAFIGVPIEFNSVRRGTLLGPQAIRTAELLLHWHAGGAPLQEHTEVMIDPFSILTVVDYGDVPVDFFPLLRAMPITTHVVGVDLVEVSPMNDNRSGTTMLLGSRLFHEVITGMALKKKGITDPWYIHPDLIVKK